MTICTNKRCSCAIISTTLDISGNGSTENPYIIDDVAGPDPQRIIFPPATTYDAVLADSNTLVVPINAAGCEISIDLVSVIGWVPGHKMDIISSTLGPVTVVGADPGVTIAVEDSAPAELPGLWARAELQMITPDLWVLTPKRSLDIADITGLVAALDGKRNVIQTITFPSGAGYSPVLADVDTLLGPTNAAGCVITIGTVATKGWVSGQRIYIKSMSAGPVTIVGAGGVTIAPAAPKTAGLRATFSGCELQMVTPDLWVPEGDLVDPSTATAIVAERSATATLSNKRITPRVTAIASSATPTINTDNCDAVDITALATAITSMTTNLTGTPNNKDKLLFEIKDNGTARAITWGASFVAGGVPLPTTTVLSKIMTVLFIYSTANALNKWRCVAAVIEA